MQDRSSPQAIDNAIALQKFGVGQPVRRKEDDTLVRGKGRYTDDFQLPGQAHAWIVRSTHAHGLIREIDNGLRVRSVKTLDAELERTFGEERLITQGLGFLGGLALLLACVGLYGVMSFTVASRTTEIGVRMALGATRAEMVRLVLRDTLTLVGIGATLGIAAAMLTTQLLQKLLFGVTPTDPITIGATTLLMFLVAALAGALPARHAAGVDPLAALRCE